MPIWTERRLPESPKSDIKSEFGDVPVIHPPSSATVDFERKPVLYLPDGRVLVRRAGFR